jgi:hypothetical protein
MAIPGVARWNDASPDVSRIVAVRNEAWAGGIRKDLRYEALRNTRSYISLRPVKEFLTEFPHTEGVTVYDILVSIAEVRGISVIKWPANDDRTG